MVGSDSIVHALLPDVCTYRRPRPANDWFRCLQQWSRAAWPQQSVGDVVWLSQLFITCNRSCC
jgi:hypothetical protein